MTENRKYDIALSFAGEERDYVDRVANLLKDRGVSVFYDLFEEADLWGKDLYTHLSEVYRERARFTVIFISKAYANKRWTNHERKSAQARAFQETQEYILPARFDDTEIPGILPTVGYVSLQGLSPDDLASLVIKKLISTGGTVPTELVRRDFSILASAKTRLKSKFGILIIDDEGRPIEGCQLTVQAENGTFHSSRSNGDGTVEFEPNVRRSITLLASHPHFPAAVCQNVDLHGTMPITLKRIENVGSITIDRTGYIPGLKGRLNLILDRSNRTYLYADNIAIDGGKAQPVSFSINAPFELEDADGTIVYATVKYIAASISLLQYTRKANV